MKKNSKSLLIVSSEFPPQPGGIGNHAYNLAYQLNSHGFEVSVITDARSTSGHEEKRFDKELPFEVLRVWVKRPRLLMYIKRLLLLRKALKNHCVIIASGKFSLWSVSWFSWFYRRHYLAVVHGTEVNFKSFPVKLMVNLSLIRFPKIIAVSSYTKLLLKQTFQRKTTVIPNGVDETKWNTKAASNISIKGAPKLITVGNVTERKGQIQVIEHLPMLIKTYPQIHYHCVGIPTEQENCLQKAKTLGVENHVTFHGRVSHNDLISLVGTSDIFVMLSTETETGDVEGFGIAIIEANTLGIPAIGSKNNGIEDAVQNEKSGVLIDAMDTSAFINAIETILSNKETFSKQASIWANQHRWEEIIKQYIDVIEDL
ncbi:glycosyltransferase family 4 protein [Seonamhaeicola sediminis]|uniref:Glycosyltransferase family 4 protein n=1 Tax=Seonamhaeicola sediminis TaxID=2528206 RepID=A0A562YH65_9FLAO|nr:glycosyltransferase family 4 protein [Seonamhaeicola sediminis]TWO34363.1 glycosyltransferase family 4 protein [Seonamhaeicola sediminis]